MTKIELFSIPMYLVNEERYLKTLTDRMNNYACKFSDDRKEEAKSVWKKYNYINKPWKYNQIIGYVEIVYRDNSIYFDIYKVSKKRLRVASNRKSYISYMPTSGFHFSNLKNMTNEEIKVEINKWLQNIEKTFCKNKEILDKKMFDVQIEYIDLKSLINDAKENVY